MERDRYAHKAFHVFLAGLVFSVAALAADNQVEKWEPVR